MASVVTCFKLISVLVLCWCRFLCLPVDRSVNAYFSVHAFAVPFSFSIKQSSAFGTFPYRPRCSNALTYQSIDLEQYVPIAKAPYLAAEVSNTAHNKYGVTSLLVMPLRTLNQADSICHDNEVDASHDIIHVLIGTKYGALVDLPMEMRNASWMVSGIVPVEWPSRYSPPTPNRKLPFPNYSIASITGNFTTMVLVGSADRYVHIWQNNYPWNRKSDWNMTQRLGPHTGWVKSLAVLPSILPTNVNQSHHHSIHSIDTVSCVQHRFVSLGCNHIEYWKYNCICENDTTNNEWTHIGTTSITSSPAVSLANTSNPTSNAVCTLSSDLLCVEICNVVTALNQTNTIIAVGGVDGRIHFYKDRRTETDGLEHLVSVTAHRGRVNVLSYDTTRQCLMSGSHDGTIHGWSLHWNIVGRNKVLVVDRIASHQFHDGQRVTALLCFTPQRSNSSSMHVIAGTHNGSIHLLAILGNTELGKCAIVQISGTRIVNGNGDIDADGPIINAFCHLHANPSSYISPDVLMVGHANGMGMLQLSDEGEGHA